MAKLSKRMRAIREKVDAEKVYPIDEAVTLLNEIAGAKFKESFDVAVNLGIDPRHFRTHNRLGELWLAQGKLVRARASLERAAALAPRDARTRKALERLADAERAGS